VNANIAIIAATSSRKNYSLPMESVSVAKLKSNLSRYLAAIRKGTEIVVTSHRHPIARIVPVEKWRQT
jgi:prevent-host-death family protein